MTLIGQGASNNEIAAALFLTRTTARTYVSRILTKLGARDRAQLVVIAYESGLVGPSTV
ncbi:response regulator transcription factor [Paenarthrobacter nicotinovorans]|uniref:response regulator transcription factor n=1 Tax=Paenarthrobacter nicotinovorans TaxID=29320 RepID=UPI0032AFA73A